MSSQDEVPDPFNQSQSSNSSQSNEKRWILKDGNTMNVTSHGKKRSSDKHMTIDLMFCLENDPEPKFVGNFTN